MSLCVYGMVTAPIDGVRFVKFGISSALRDRVQHVQHGCPLHLDAVMFVECGSLQAQERLEAALHAEHADQSVGGEWFRIPADGAIEEVRDAMLYVGQRELGRAEVQEMEMPRRVDARARALGRYRKRALRAVVIGDTVPGSVPVLIRRKITLDRTG